MKGRVIILDNPEDRPYAAALMVNGRLEDLMLSAPRGDLRPYAGDIAVVRVTRKLPKAGAFCEMANGQGYLRDAKTVKEGDLILAQVLSLPEPGKAVTLTTRILYKGPRVILTPGSPGVNISKKIGNEAERERLKSIVERGLTSIEPVNAAAEAATEIGAIVRTSARGESEEVLAREVKWVIGKYDCARGDLAGARTVSGRGGDPMSVALRDWLFPVPDAIATDQSTARILVPRDTAGDHNPNWFYGDEQFVQLVQPDPSPFDAFGVWDEIERLKSPEVSRGDGSLVIEATRALVAVDVNTGADTSPAAGLKANLAVARELPRQLRLRGLGGKIVVDFAPMPKSARRGVEDALKKAFRADPIETSLVGWTTLGLVELQRKRERWPLMELL